MQAIRHGTMLPSLQRNEIGTSASPKSTMRDITYRAERPLDEATQ
jgi:hypothetical protein